MSTCYRVTSNGIEMYSSTEPLTALDRSPHYKLCQPEGRQAGWKGYIFISCSPITVSIRWKSWKVQNQIRKVGFIHVGSAAIASDCENLFPLYSRRVTSHLEVFLLFSRFFVRFVCLFYVFGLSFFFFAGMVQTYAPYCVTIRQPDSVA